MALARMLGFLLAFAALANAVEERNSLNPIRKVVTLLQSMQKKVEEEGAREAELFEKFDCYCKGGRSDLTASISAAEAKAPAVGGAIDEAEAKLASAKAALKQAQTDRSAAKSAMAEATAIREKEAGTFAGFKSDHETNIAAIAKAVDAISKGVAGSFLQTPAAQVLRRSASKSNLVISDQEELVAFLSQGSTYAPQSGEILGILKQMGDSMAAALADATSTEKDAISAYDGLIAAKTKEVNVLIATIEAKTGQIGELGVSIVRMKEDLTDTQQALLQDKKFLAELEKGCSSKAAEWELRKTTRAEELVALSDTIKVLNDDDALELFKKTLPSASASLIQVQQGMSTTHARALEVLRSANSVAPRTERPGLEMIMLALSGKSHASGGFGPVIKMIDNLVTLLGKEQVDDDDKKEYCGLQFDSSEDKKKDLDRAVAGAEASIASAKDAIASLVKEIAALETAIRALDASVAGATAQRKDENAEYKALVTSDTAAQEVLAFAKNRLNKFYNPKLYKAPAPEELSAGDRIYSNEGGELTTAAPGGIAGTGITAFAQVSLHSQGEGAPAAPPSTWGAYATKSSENNGVIAMIDLLIADLAKELQQAGVQEKDSQAEYEQLMKDSAEKRAGDSKSLTEKAAAKADMDASLQAHTQARAENAKEAMLTAKYISSLHGECDWLLQYYDARKAARADEIESLNRAKAVLSGADYSLIQSTKIRGHLRGRTPFSAVEQKSAVAAKSCSSEDLQRRVQLQNKLAGVCEDMCKEVGAYPKCSQCVGFVAPDSTPGVVTWEELLTHMDNLVEWSAGELKSWRKTAAGSALQVRHVPLAAVEQKSAVSEQACEAEDLKHRAQFQNKLAGVCEDMCKEVGAYPKCSQCVGFVAPDSTPGVVTWEELLTHMDNLVEWSAGELKSWRKTAAGSALQLRVG